MPGAAAAPLTWCGEHPTICTLGEDAAAILERIPAVLASSMLLSMEGDKRPDSTRWSKFPGCSAQYQNDRAICQRRKTSSCWSSAAERLAHCNATGGEVGWPPLSN